MHAVSKFLISVTLLLGLHMLYHGCIRLRRPVLKKREHGNKKVAIADTSRGSSQFIAPRNKPCTETCRRLLRGSSDHIHEPPLYL